MGYRLRGRLAAWLARPEGRIGDTVEVAGAVLAATDTLRDGAIPEGRMLEDTRRVWGPFDHATAGPSRMVKRPA